MHVPSYYGFYTHPWYTIPSGLPPGGGNQVTRHTHRLEGTKDQAYRPFSPKGPGTRHTHPCGQND